MNTKQIIAELRRSACEDELPARTAASAAYWVARDYCDCAISDYPDIALRTFYLFVAEAIESANRSKK